MATFSIVLNIWLNFIPGQFLRMLPFTDKLRVRKTTLAVIYLLFFSAIALVFIGIQQRDGVDFRVVQRYKMVQGVIGILLPFALIKESPFKLLFLYFFNVVYVTVVIRMANHIDARYFEGGIQNASFIGNNVIMLVLLAVTVPAMELFILRVIKPILETRFYPDIWRLLWIVPAIFFATLVTDSVSNDFSIQHTGSIGFLLMSLFIVCGMIAIYLILVKVVQQAAENATLKENARLGDSLLAIQRDQYARLTESMEQTTVARHDMRHQLTVMKGYLSGEDVRGALSYCDELAGSIPSTTEQILCDNFAVNAVAQHYLAIAGREGIITNVRLDIPERAGCVSDMDLCVVMGNLLENAVEACRRMERGERFIRVRSVVDGDYLSLIVENSFDGLWNQRDGVYLSRKHGEGEAQREGVGLSSVRAVSARYDGLAKCEVIGNVWKSSMLVHMEECI